MTEPSDFQDKYVVFIASAGRTGTKFFGNILSDIVKDSFSVHEPDVFSGFNKTTWKAVKDFGLYHMIIGRFLKQTGIRNVTQNYLAGKLSDEDLVRFIRDHREAYYNHIEKPYIIESYSQWYGIIPGIAQTFPHYKIAGIIRDPRTWVQSIINYGILYHENRRLFKYGHTTLTPFMTGDPDYIKRWPNMSSFQRSCWFWTVVTQNLKKYEIQDPHTKIFYFENLFQSPDRSEHMNRLLEFITNFEHRSFSYKFDLSTLNSIRNSSQEKTMPHWQEWPPELCRQLHDICGPLMQGCGYGMEPEWQDKLS